MRQTISGLVAAIAVVAASSRARDGVRRTVRWCVLAVRICQPLRADLRAGLHYSGCNTGCGGWSYHERLPDPVQQYGAAPMASPQYYYVDQGPTYTGPGDFAPYPAYQEGGVSG